MNCGHYMIKTNKNNLMDRGTGRKCITKWQNIKCKFYQYLSNEAVYDDFNVCKGNAIRYLLNQKGAQTLKLFLFLMGYFSFHSTFLNLESDK